MLTYSQEVSTLPSVYLTAIYSLFDLANTQKGYISNTIIFKEILLTFIAYLDSFYYRRVGTCFYPALPILGCRGR